MGCGGKAHGEDRFGFGGWSEEDGAPVLIDAQARIVCAKEARFDYGSHTIFIGRVTSVGIHGEVDPLIYVDGHYTGLPADEFLAPIRRSCANSRSARSGGRYSDSSAQCSARIHIGQHGLSTIEEEHMIYVSKEVAANAPGHPKLSRSEIWKGLVMKADNALPFVPGMAKCDVIERTANGLVRDIVFRGEDARERITFYPEQKVVFLRLSGNADGFIVNEVLGDDDDLRLRFSFALQLVDAPSDSAKEREFRDVMERDYLKAVDATLGAIRKMVSERQPAT